ncbi:MFS transporter [Caldalkalibacillus mannanilyticus]|uniref:MFS transporter n=1 Tax=Caldalkalibacillus mannanilyticus TaxID=1418 RepID=UPI000A86EF99|nr:MFS transporter [Caldalkalibacillus mannanilyticus]
MNYPYSLWKQPNFIKLWFSQTANILGQIVLEIVLISQVYRLTGSVFGASLVPAITSISVFLGSFLASYYISRFDQKRLLHTIGWIRAILTLLFIWLASGFQTDLYVIIGILVFKFILSFVGSWYGPARFALLPLIVSREQYIKANGTLTVVQQLLMTAGWALGSASLFLFSNVQLLMFCCLMFALSGVLIQSIQIQQKEEKKEAKKRAKPGWQLALQSPMVRSITMMDIVEGLANAIWSSALLLGFTTLVLKETEEWWGFINAGYFIGAILGGLVVVLNSKILERRMTFTIALSAICMSILTFFFSIVTIPILSVLLCILMGPMYQIRDICQSTILQDVIPERERASVMAARNIILSPWNGVVIPMMGFLSEIIGVRNVFLLASLLYLLTAIIVMLQPQLRSYSYRVKEETSSLN